MLNFLIILADHHW